MQQKTISGARHGFAIAEGVSLAKDLGNLPPNICTPSYLARTAQKIARRYPNVSTRVLNEVEIKQLGMRSFLSVTGGTTLPAKLITMQYKGANKDKPLVLIGKGITFDAGGISLKPGLAMDEMKFDMCGAASVIGTMAVIASLQLPINLNIVVPACENLPSGTATRPGDIIKSMSGQTIEILNTDAEGRLILCDAITYSRRFKPDVVIDVATLTGACVVALGKHRTGIMSYNDNLAQEIHDAGVSANDQGWRLPLGEDYEEQLKSNFADFANIGGRDAGASTAGCFLGKFAEDLNWAHLDIAGIAYRSGAAKGSTGRPVPMLSEFLLRQPGLAMDEMKFDMCGAASVIGTMAVIASLQLPINLNIVVPACENLPSGTATRPGDIIKSMSGQTIEILNTDAEGRLILCDAITYSRRFKPDVVIDVATLTGACVVALGKHRTGIMSYNDNLAQEIHDAGVSANDQGWRLPLGEDYEEQLKSNFADFANIGGRDAGASTAGCFLGKFAEDLNWAHLDIAGIAYRSGAAKGSTGRPVPMLSEFLLRRAGQIF